MSELDAEKFYEKNNQSEASFTILTKPPTSINSWLSIVLQRVLHEKLAGHSFSGVVQTTIGPVVVTSELYHALLAIQARKDVDNAPIK